MTTSTLIKRALERADKLVTDSPQRGQRTYVNRAVLSDGTRCTVEEKDHAFVTDVGRGLGGSDEWPTPGTLLRSALSSCVAIGIQLWAARREIPVDHIEVTLEGDSDARGILGLSDTVSPGFTGLRVRIEVRSPAPAASVEAAIADSLRYSPIWDAVGNAQTITHDIRVSGAKELADGGVDGR